MSEQRAIDNLIAPGVVARVSGTLRAAWEAGMSAWFSALPPLPQVAPPDTPVRRFDFPVGQNINYIPRSGETTTFAQLRALADNYDLLRTVIETRKDQLAKVPWTIRTVSRLPLPVPRKGASAGNGRPGMADDVAMLKDFFESPDGEHSLIEWMRPLAEDLLVIDAPAIEPVRTRGGELQKLLVIDGATIFPVIDEATGFTPAPPLTAYQQIIKGVVAANLTADELIYRPRNRRTHKLYGFSPVEQVVMSGNLGLRRQMSQLAYYTDGTVPDAYLGVPDTWTPDQITEYQQVFDAYLSGNLHNRRKIFLGPDGKLQLLKEPDLKAELDEWLARVVCFAFSISPQPFIREMNRATAQTAKQQSLEEGLQPLQVYFADLFNFIVRKYFGITDLEFAWQDEKAEDPQDQAEIAALLVTQGIITPNEARERLGMEPHDNGDDLTLPGADDEAHDTFQARKLRKKKAVLSTTPGIEVRELDALPRLTAELTAFFKEQARITAGEIRKYYPAALAQMPAREAGKLQKNDWAEKAQELASEVAGRLTLNWDGLITVIENALQEAITAAFERVRSWWRKWTENPSVDLPPSEVLPPPQTCNPTNDDFAWARDRAAEMVGRMRVNGVLIPDPDPTRAITESTRAALKAMIIDALVECKSVDELAAEIEAMAGQDGRTLFNQSRAGSIALTELAQAYSYGFRSGALQVGFDMHASVLCPAHEPEDEDICDLAASDGQIPIDQPFSNGQMGPLYHPCCLCTEMLYIGVVPPRNPLPCPEKRDGRRGKYTDPSARPVRRARSR